MATPVELRKGNVRKKGFVGLKWTTFFLVCLVPLFKGDLTWAVVMLLAGMLSFFYNKCYTEKLLREGFEPVGDVDRAALEEAGLYAE